MKTRRIQGTDIQAALREVRRSLGPDAVIMSTRETADGVEILAAGSPPSPRSRRRRVSARAPRTEPAAVSAPSPAERPPLGTGLANLAASFARPDRREQQRRSVASRLDALGLGPDLRDALLVAVESQPPERAWGAALDALAARITVNGSDLIRAGGRVALLGGTGVGKTTTVAKLAAHFARLHGTEQVALINMDTYRIAASEQLGRFGRLLGIPVLTARGTSELAATLARLADRRLVLVDVPGAAHEQRTLANHLDRLDIGCLLTVSLNTQIGSLIRTMRAFAGVSLDGCVLTKEDEAVSLGPALSVAVRHRLALSFVTNGPGVPTDIRIARPEQLVARAVELLELTRRDEHAYGTATASTEASR